MGCGIKSILGSSGCVNYHEDRWCDKIVFPLRKDEKFICRKYGELDPYRDGKEPIRAKACADAVR